MDIGIDKIILKYLPEGDPKLMPFDRMVLARGTTGITTLYEDVYQKINYTITNFIDQRTIDRDNFSLDIKASFSDTIIILNNCSQIFLKNSFVGSISVAILTTNTEYYYKLIYRCDAQILTYACENPLFSSKLKFMGAINSQNPQLEECKKGIKDHDNLRLGIINRYVDPQNEAYVDKLDCSLGVTVLRETKYAISVFKVKSKYNIGYYWNDVITIAFNEINLGYKVEADYIYFWDPITLHNVTNDHQLLNLGNFNLDIYTFSNSIILNSKEEEVPRLVNPILSLLAPMVPEEGG